MSDVFPYGRRSYYPHMKPADIEIWERFIDKNPAAYETVQYDVAVGSPPLFDTVVSPATGGDVEKLYKKKIDVVGLKDGKLDIIEIKPRAGMSSLGQVKGYVTLYLRDIKPTLPVRPVILTDQIGLDMPELAANEGVQLLAA